MFRIFLIGVVCLAFAPKSSLSTPSNCREAVKHYGFYGKLPIKVPGVPQTFDVKCEHSPTYLPVASTDPWNIVLRREWGLENFNRSWNDYEEGFGALYNDFFLGLKYVHALTTATENELWVELEDWDRNKRWALYDNFVIGAKDQLYPITSLGKYDGNAGDSLRYHEGSKFTTFDKDNDESQLENCAKLYSSGWWFKKCITSNLHGLWIRGEYNASYANGIVWYDWHGYRYSLRYVHMAIRPKANK